MSFLVNSVKRCFGYNTTPVAPVAKKEDKKATKVAKNAIAAPSARPNKAAAKKDVKVFTAPVKKAVQTRSVLKTALVSAAVLAVLSGGAVAAYKFSPAVAEKVNDVAEKVNDLGSSIRNAALSSKALIEERVFGVNESEAPYVTDCLNPNFKA